MPGASPYEQRLIAEAMASSLPRIEPGVALVLAPDTIESRLVCDSAVWPALGEYGYRRPADWFAFDSDAALHEIARWLHQAELIVADVSGCNPDVMYAVGLCHGIGRCPLLISQDTGNLPAAMKSFRCMAYMPDAEGLRFLREELSRAVRVFLASAAASRKQ